MALALTTCLLVAHLAGCLAARAEEAAGPGGPKYLLQYELERGESLAYRVLISETIYQDGKRTTSLYREDFRVENAADGSGRVRQAVVCSGMATPEGGAARRLEPFRYYLVVDKTGRVLQVEGLRPWDGRQLETVWLAQLMLADQPVAPGDTWTVSDEAYSIAGGNLALEKRTYEFVGIERVGATDAFKVKFDISRKGRLGERDYTYVGTGAFYLASGKPVKLDSSEVVTFSGNGNGTKVITMVQVEIAK